MARANDGNLPSGNARRRFPHHATTSGFVTPDVCANTCIRWETSFERLAEIFESTPARRSSQPSRAITLVVLLIYSRSG